MTKRTENNEADPQADHESSISPGGTAPASASPGSAEPTASPSTFAHTHAFRDALDRTDRALSP